MRVAMSRIASFLLVFALGRTGFAFVQQQQTASWSSTARAAGVGDGDYLSALGGGAVTKMPPRGKSKTATKGIGYLDDMGSAASSYAAPVSSYATTPAPAPVSAPGPAWSATPAINGASGGPANGDYLSALGGGPVKKMPPRGLPKTASKGTGYLDNMDSAASTAYSTSAASSWASPAPAVAAPAAQPAPAWSSTPPAASASVPSGGDYLSALGSGPVKKMPPRGLPKTASKGMGYLDNMGSAASPSYSTPAVSQTPAAQPAAAWSSTPPAATASVPSGGDYLSALGGGPVKKMPPRGVPKTASKGMGYLDNMGSAASPSYSTPAVSPAPAAQPDPAWSSTPPVAGPSVAAGGDYLSALGGGPVKKMPPRGLPKTSTKGTGYLENMGRAAPPKDWSSQSGQSVASTTGRIPQAAAPTVAKFQSEPKAFAAPRRKVADAADPNWLSTVPALRGSAAAGGAKPKLASGLGRKVADTPDPSWGSVIPAMRGSSMPAGSKPKLASGLGRKVADAPDPSWGSVIPAMRGSTIPAGSKPKLASGLGRKVVDSADPSWMSMMSSLPSTGARIGASSQPVGRSVQSAKASVPAGADYLASLGGSPVKKMHTRGKPKTAAKGSGYLDNMGRASPTRPSQPSRLARKVVDAPDPSWGSAVPAMRGSSAGGSKPKLASGLGRKVVDSPDPLWMSTASKISATGARLGFNGAQANGSQMKAKNSAGRGQLDAADPNWLSSRPDRFAVNSSGAANPRSPVRNTAEAASSVPAGADYLSSLGGGPVKKMPLRGKPKTATKGTGYLDNMRRAVQ